MDIGLTLSWSSPRRAIITIAQDADLLRGNVCGLCGNHNEVKFDDFETPEGALVSIKPL